MCSSDLVWIQTPVTKLYKVDSKYTNEDLWIVNNTGGKSMIISAGQKFLSHKFRCRIISSWKTAKNNGGINVFNGKQKIYGKLVNLNSKGNGYCGDKVCSSIETELNCSVDCEVISSNPVYCGEGLHYETINDKEVCVADLFYFIPFWVTLNWFYFVFGFIGLIIIVVYVVYKKIGRASCRERV